MMLGLGVRSSHIPRSSDYLDRKGLPTTRIESATEPPGA
jgi:hypothetical protein